MKILQRIPSVKKRLAAFFTKNRKQILFISSLLIMTAILSFYIWQEKIDEDIRSSNVQILNEAADTLVGEITLGREIRQTFQYQGDFEGVAILFATYGRRNESFLNIAVKDITNNQILYSHVLDSVALEDNEYYKVIFDASYGHKEMTEYEIIISTDNSDVGEAVTIWCSNEDVIPEGSLSISGTPQPGDINYGLLQKGSRELVVAYFVLVVILGLALVLVFAFTYIFKAKVEVMFLVCAIMFGTVYSLILSPGAIPDEYFHMDMAYRYSNQLLDINRVSNEQIQYRKVDAENWIITKRADAEHYQRLLDTPLINSEDKDETVIGPADKSSIYGLLYLPSALGISLARILNLGTIPMLYMGRLFNFFVFIFGIYFAIKITPIGKNIFFLTAMFPMTMQLAFSFSYDSVMTGGLFLLSALYLKAICSDSVFALKDKLILIALSALLLPGKAIYVFILCLAFLIPKSKFANTKRKVHFVSALFAVSLVSFFLVNLSVMLFSFSGEIAPGHLTERYSLDYIFRNPAEILQILINTMLHKSEFYFSSLVGRGLGWLDVSIPMLLVLFSFSLFIIACFTDTNRAPYDRIKHPVNRLVLFFTFAMVVLASMFVMLLSWTSLGSSMIEGVQGRYFLPVLPLLGLCLYSKHIKIDEGILKHVYMGIGLLHFTVLYYIL
jgi:uncharacterized membrane protein